MNKLKMGAKAGVTLVELLVVILIVTILSVALLPLLKPYIEESKYAAEPIPVLANVQTKINLYQYEKDNLPGTVLGDTYGHTWTNNPTTTDGVVTYKRAKWTYTTNPSDQPGASSGSVSDWASTDGTHLQDAIDVDWQDLLGRRMNPSHFVYHLIKGDGSSKYGYAVGVFGDGNGLGKGTGYAVMTIVDTVSTNKVVATWSRYKPVSDAKISFYSGNLANASKGNNGCWVPTKAMLVGGQWNNILQGLKKSGWTFMNDDLVTSP